MVEQFVQDIDILLSRILKTPEIGISVLYALVLNSENNIIDVTLYQKIFNEFFLTDSKFLQQIESKSIDPSKGVILAKCVKFFKTYR